MEIVRRLASTYASSLVFGLIPTISYALGLGEIHLHSHLNEPLQAEIALEDVKGIEPTDIIAALADPTAFRKEGLEFSSWLNAIHFKVMQSQDGRAIIQLTTEQPVRDPFADLLVQATWPGGKIIREYTLLLDPPRSVFANQPLGVQITPKKHHVIHRHENSGSVQKTGSNLFGKQYGPVYNETLWSIAKKLVAKSPYTIHGGVTAIVQKNPQAFKNGNINQMIQGVVLDLPTQAELSLQSPQEVKEVAEAGKSTVKMVPTELTSNAHPSAIHEVAKDTSSKRLTLVSQPSGFEESTGSLQDRSSGHVSQRLSLIEEALDTLKRTNEDISQKNQNLQYQNESLVSLLAKKDEEINRLKMALHGGSMIPHEPPMHESFAVIVPDYPKKAKVASPFEQEVAQSNNAPLQGLPKDILTKEKPEKVSTHLASDLNKSLQEEHNLTANPMHHVKRDIIYFIFIILLCCSITGWLWFSRQSLQTVGVFLLEQWGKITRYISLRKGKLFALKPLHKTQPINESHNKPCNKPKTSQSVSFDLNKSLSAVADEEKRTIKTQSQEKQADIELKDIELMDVGETYLRSNKPSESFKTIEKIEKPQKRISTTLEDIDTCIAYERYSQAEKLLHDLLLQNAHHWEALLKLLELYVLTEKYDEYRKWYTQIPRDLKRLSPSTWAKIALLQEKVQAEKSIDVDNQIIKEVQPVVDKKIETVAQKDLPKPVVEISDEPNQLEINQPKKKSSWGKLELVKESEDFQSQLSLAKAYIEVGDIEPAREILVHVLSQGTQAQAQAAQALLDRINNKTQ